tara:strand:+ start:2912 stop:3229 length:318 start_codon:yes stop_codon:yes gene_type:complete
MSDETTDTTFTERGEDGDFTIDIVAYVANSRIFINFSSPEHDAQFSFDNGYGLSLAEARLHPALIKQFIEEIVGEGEVKCFFERRSDVLARMPKQRSARGRGGQR